MNINYRVSLGFAAYPDAALDEFGGSILSGMTGNPAFPSPPLDPVTGFKPLAIAFHDALIAAAPGGKILTSIKKDARKAMLTGLRQEAAYVQSMSGQDVTTLLTSGFLVSSTNRAQTPLDTPAIAVVDNSVSGQFTLRLTGVNNARSYEVQIKSGTGGWTAAGIFTRSRNITLLGLTPGTVYTMQVRGVGGSTGYSSWSMPATLMAL